MNDWGEDFDVIATFWSRFSATLTTFSWSTEVKTEGHQEVLSSGGFNCAMEGIRAGRAGPSLSPASASLQPGHKLLGRLVLQVGAYVAGVSAVCVASEQTPVTRTHAFRREVSIGNGVKQEL